MAFVLSASGIITSRQFLSSVWGTGAERHRTGAAGSLRSTELGLAPGCLQQAHDLGPDCLALSVEGRR